MPILTGTGILFQSANYIDADAQSYVDAIVAAGANVSDTQLSRISGFYTAAKEGGYYTSLKRLYLPIWGVAAANAIDMIGLTSGTFNGGVTHGAGFVPGNGTTGKFSFDISPLTSGLTISDGAAFGILYTAGAAYNGIVGRYPNILFAHAVSNTELRWDFGNDSSSTLSQAATLSTGVLVGNRVGGVRAIYGRNSGGFQTIATRTDASVGDMNGSDPIEAMSLGAITWYQTGKMGAYGVSMGFTNPQDFTLHLKTLWEGCTGLTLP